MRVLTHSFPTRRACELRRSPPLVGHAYHRGLANGRVHRDDARVCGGVYILAAADDHVLYPVADEEIALGVEIAGVARQEEAIRGEHLRAFFGALPIAGHRRAAPDPDFEIGRESCRERVCQYV